MKYQLEIIEDTKVISTINSRHATLFATGTAGTLTVSISGNDLDDEEITWTEQDTYTMSGTTATIPATFNCAAGTLVKIETTGTFTDFAIIWEG